MFIVVLDGEGGSETIFQVFYRGIEPQASFSTCFLVVSEGEGGRETMPLMFDRGIEPQASFSWCFLVVCEGEGGIISVRRRSYLQKRVNDRPLCL